MTDTNKKIDGFSVWLAAISVGGLLFFVFATATAIADKQDRFSSVCFAVLGFILMVGHGAAFVARRREVARATQRTSILSV